MVWPLWWRHPSHPVLATPGNACARATISRLAQFSDRNQKLTRAVNCTFLGSETVEVGTPNEEFVGFVSGIANW
jgi:hypothetical protein